MGTLEDLEKPNAPKAEFNHTPISRKLDKLYNKNVRCPYCGTKIPKFTAGCENCGITKVQIAESIVNRKDRKKYRKRLWSRILPADIPFWKVALAAMFGFTGAHCFLTKRWIRGTYILTAMILMFVGFAIWPIKVDDELEAVVTTGMRYQMDSVGLFAMPQDVAGVAAVVMWIWDWIAVVFGWYKYPIYVDIDKGKEPQGKQYVRQF
jgi:hypothetical protein